MFKDDKGKVSILRVINFINCLIASYATITIIEAGDITYAGINLIFGLWLLCYAGKSAQKYLETIKKPE